MATNDVDYLVSYPCFEESFCQSIKGNEVQQHAVLATYLALFIPSLVLDLTYKVKVTAYIELKKHILSQKI